MLENFFLTYANHDFRYNSNNLELVLAEIEPLFRGPDPFKEFIFPTMIDIASKTLEQCLEQRVRYLSKNFPYIRKWYASLHAIYGYTEDHCYKDCWVFNKIDYDENIRTAGLPANTRLKCHECFQLRFINILDDVTHHERPLDEVGSVFWEYDDSQSQSTKSFKVSSLALMIENAYSYVHLTAKVSGFDIKTGRYLRCDEFGDIENMNKTVINRAIMNAAILSLSEYLLHNDRRKIRRCAHCRKFYLSIRVGSSKHCSERCRYLAHQSRKIGEKTSEANKR